MAAFHSNKSGAWNLSRDCPQVLIQVFGGLSTGQNVPSFFYLQHVTRSVRRQKWWASMAPGDYYTQNPQPSVIFRPLAMAEGDQVTDPLQFSQQCRDKLGGLTHCLIRHVFA